ncbi:MAG: voltage-gated potassium channel [Candidatus Latescibacterota bacterium]|jgi:voltage-gated potassium channel
MKRRLYAIMEKATPGDRTSLVVDFFILSLILLNVGLVIVATVDNYQRDYREWFNLFETVSVVVFSIEYALRIWCCTADSHYHHPISGRLRFMKTPLALIDLVAIFPYYVVLFISVSADFTLPLRLLRLFRLFKLGRYSRSMRLFGQVLWHKREELYVVVFVLFIMLVSVSSLMYFVEHETQPEAFSSIPATMWWGIVTLTTVGYGDIFPVTPLGKFLGALIAIMGVGLFALPAGILSSGFVEALQRRNEKNNICPHCGRDVTDHSG